MFFEVIGIHQGETVFNLGVPLIMCQISDWACGTLFPQAQLPPFPGKVVLLSPIVGEFANQETEMNFIPPRSEYLLELAKTGLYPALSNCEMHVGADDWQSNPSNVEMFGTLTGLKVTVVPEAGHMLPKEYVNNLLDQWL